MNLRRGVSSDLHTVVLVDFYPKYVATWRCIAMQEVYLDDNQLTSDGIPSALASLPDLRKLCEPFCSLEIRLD